MQLLPVCGDGTEGVQLSVQTSRNGERPVFMLFPDCEQTPVPTIFHKREYSLVPALQKHLTKLRRNSGGEFLFGPRAFHSRGCCCGCLSVRWMLTPGTCRKRLFMLDCVCSAFNQKRFKSCIRSDVHVANSECLGCFLEAGPHGARLEDY